MIDENLTLTKLPATQDSRQEMQQKNTSQVNCKEEGVKPDFSAAELKRKQSRWHHVWLIYSLFMFMPLFYKHSHKLVIGLAIAYPLFLLFYFGAHYGPSLTVKRIALGCLSLLGLVYNPINSGACGIFIFAAAILPFLVESATVVFWLIGTQIVAILVESWVLHVETWSAIVATVFSLLTGFNNLRNAQQFRADAKLRLAHEEVEQLAKLAERERIARDLHDVLGHTLSLIVLKSELAQRLNAQDPERATQEMRDVEQTARKALADVRQAISGYRAEGLKAELEKTRLMLDAAGISFLCDSHPPRLPATDEAVLSLIVREAVTNIVRHSQAKQCRMQFNVNNGVTTLTIHDDGGGEIKAEGNGIRGMRERIEALGGSFELRSKQGTTLNVKLPRVNGSKGLLQ